MKFILSSAFVALSLLAGGSDAQRLNRGRRAGFNNNQFGAPQAQDSFNNNQFGAPQAQDSFNNNRFSAPQAQDSFVQAQNFFAARSGRSRGGGARGDTRGGARGGGARGGRGDVLEKVVACQEELTFDCGLDFDVPLLIETLMVLEAEKEAGVRPTIADGVKSQLEEVRQCLRAIKSELLEDSECKLALKGDRGGNRDRPGDRLEGAVERLWECQAVLDEAVLDGECSLDFDVLELLEVLEALQASAAASGSELQLSEDIKAKLVQTKLCLKDVVPFLPEDDTCKLAAAKHRGGMTV